MLANFRRHQAGTLRTGLRREWVPEALGKGRHRWLQPDAIPNHFLRIAPGWDFRLSASGKRSSWAQFLLDFNAVGCGQAWGWLGAGRSGRYLSLLSSGHHLLDRIGAGELLRLRRLRAGAPSLRTDGLVAAGFGFLRGHPGRAFRAGLLLAVFLLAEVRQSVVPAGRR